MSIQEPHYSFHNACGYRLRVARWRFDSADLRTRRPLLIFNGIGSNIEMLAPIAEALGDRPVVTFDVPGVGKSPDTPFPYNAATLAFTSDVLLNQLGAEQVDLLGISWGGGIAQQFALQHRARVGRLVLAATSAGMVMAPPSHAILVRLLDPIEYTAPRALKRNLAMLYNGGGVGQPISLNAATSPTPAGWLYQFAALAAWSSVPLLPLLDVPTLILTGDEDQVVPPLNARFLHALIPNSRLQTFGGGGHLFMYSHLDEFAREISEFLSEEDAPRSLVVA